LCVFSATPLLPSIVDSENHIFLAVLGRPGLRLAREVQVSERVADCDHTSAAASSSRQRASRHRLRIRAPALGLEILINMRGPPCGLKREEAATASASSPDPVSVVIDDWLKSFSAFGLG
jgi:hypothetical protein